MVTSFFVDVSVFAALGHAGALCLHVLLFLYFFSSFSFSSLPYYLVLIIILFPVLSSLSSFVFFCRSLCRNGASGGGFGCGFGGQFGGSKSSIFEVLI